MLTWSYFAYNSKNMGQYGSGTLSVSMIQTDEEQTTENYTKYGIASQCMYIPTINGILKMLKWDLREQCIVKNLHVYDICL